MSLIRCGLGLLFLVVPAGVTSFQTATADDLLEKLVAVRSENVGKLTSWRGVVELRHEKSRGDAREILRKRVRFVADVKKSCCRSEASPIAREDDRLELSPNMYFNAAVIMKKDGEYYTLVSFKRLTETGELLHYRPVEVFAKLDDIPGNGDYFDPLDHWDTCRPEVEMPRRLLEAQKAGNLPANVSTRLEGSSVILASGDSRWTFDLAKGGLVSSWEYPTVGIHVTASHVNVSDIWLPLIVRRKSANGEQTFVTETVWMDQAVNFPTQGEFTLAAMGAYNGLSLFDHVRNSTTTLEGPDYPPPPANLESETNRPKEGWRE
jgi:hypothetical protein